MKILWLSHLVPYPPKGGVLQRAYYLIKGVARHNDVDLIAFNQPSLIGPLFPSVTAGLDEARRELGAFCRRLEFVEISSEQSPLGKRGLALRSLLTRDPYTINWLKSDRFANTVRQFLIAEAYDLVHFDTISLVPYAKYLNGQPAVLDHHNIESHMLLRRADHEKNALKAWYFRQEGRRLQHIEQQVCPGFAMNITCSEVDRDRLISIAPDCHAVEIPNAVDVEYFMPDTDVPHQKSLIFIGTLNWYPNAAAVRFIAFELWPVLKRQMPDISVDIIGANPPEDIRAFGESEPGFNVHGFVNDIRPLLNRAAVYVCPIMDGGGTKLKVLDALSMQKAIVAHPIACEGIHVQNGRDVLFAESVDEYATAIRRLFDDQKLRYGLGEQARKLIEEEYSHDSVGQCLSRLYEECIGAHRAGPSRA